MEEQTEDAKPVEEIHHVETVEQVTEEEHVDEDNETTEGVDVSEKEKRNVASTDEEGHDAGEDMGEMSEVEESGHVAEKGEAKEVELEFVKKKKPEPKIRKVDMDVYYPDESKSSIDDKVVEKNVVEVTAEGINQELDDSEDLIDPNKDYSVVDPSFLDEFLSSEEEQISEARKMELEKRAEAFEEAEEEEDDFQQEIYVQPPDREPSDRVYDQICDLETPVSSDESFKVPRFRYIPRRRSYPSQGYRTDDKWLARTQSEKSIEVPSNALLNLMENIAPALKKTLIEIAKYQPPNAVYYMTHSLLHKAKKHEEADLEPDPHSIQVIVDGQKKKKKPQQIPIIKKPDEVLFTTYAESRVSTPQKEVKPDIPVSDDDDDDDTSQLQKFQRIYRKAKKQIVTEEKANRSNLDRRTLLPGPCLGPTSLPLAITDELANVKLPPFTP